MKINVLDNKGKKVKETTLDVKIFGIIPNTQVVSQAIRVYNTNNRQGTVSTKDRGEVSGSGKKPWAQKKLGRARAGDKRSPLWRHGGIVHGPKPKDYKLSLPKNIRKISLASVLSQKAHEGRIFIVDDLEFEKPKTKSFKDFVSNLNLKKNTLLVLDKNDENIFLSARNLKSVKVVNQRELNVYDVMFYNNLLFVEKAVSDLTKRLKK